MDFALLPIVVFEWHVAHTAKRLTELKRRISKIETEVGSGQGSANLSHLSSDLNSCSSAHLFLDRRWHFELTLAGDLLKYFDTFAQVHVHPVGTDPQARYAPSSRQRVQFHLQLSEALGYDIKVLPRRIELQQTAVSRV